MESMFFGQFLKSIPGTVMGPVIFLGQLLIVGSSSAVEQAQRLGILLC